MLSALVSTHELLLHVPVVPSRGLKIFHSYRSSFGRSNELLMYTHKWSWEFHLSGASIRQYKGVMNRVELWQDKVKTIAPNRWRVGTVKVFYVRSVPESKKSMTMNSFYIDLRKQTPRIKASSASISSLTINISHQNISCHYFLQSHIPGRKRSWMRTMVQIAAIAEIQRSWVKMRSTCTSGCDVRIENSTSSSKNRLHQFKAVFNITSPAIGMCGTVWLAILEAWLAGQSICGMKIA